MIFHICWANGLMRFLCTFIFIFVFTHLKVLRTKTIIDLCFNTIHSRITQVHTVCSHISDLTTFIKLLCKQHGFTNTVSQFSTGFLLKGRSGERCSRCTFAGSYLNIFYGIFCTYTRFQKLLGIGGLIAFCPFCFEANGTVV